MRWCNWWEGDGWTLDSEQGSNGGETPENGGGVGARKPASALSSGSPSISQLNGIACKFATVILTLLFLHEWSSPSLRHCYLAGFYRKSEIFFSNFFIMSLRKALIFNSLQKSLKKRKKHSLMFLTWKKKLSHTTETDADCHWELC